MSGVAPRIGRPKRRGVEPLLFRRALDPMLKRTSLIGVAAGLGLSVGACATMDVSRGAERFQGGVGDAAAAPLEDLNLRRDEIPPVLVAAAAQPYSLSGMGRCSALAGEIARLDEVLGADVDVPPEASVVEDQAADLALSAVRDTATDLIPLRGWVRRLSGARAHDEAVERAIQAGIARRAYLKGVAHARRC